MVHIGLLKVYSRLTAQVHLTHSAKLTIDPFSFILHMVLWYVRCVKEKQD